MSFKKITALFLVLITVALLFAGCGTPENAQAKFEEFLDGLFAREVSDNTITLHYTLRYPEKYGLGGTEPKIYDLSLEGSEENYAEMRETLKYLKRIDERKLTKEQRYIRKMLIKYIELNLSSEGLDYYGTYLDSISGLPSNMPINFAEYSFYTEKDVTDYLALLKQFPALFEQALEHEKARAEMGLGLSDAALDEAIAQCRSFLEETDENYLISTFDKRVGALGLSAAKTAEYKRQNKEAFENEIVPAYENMIAGLEKFKGKGLNDLGLCHFEKGKEYYQFLVSYYTGSDYAASDLAGVLESKLTEYSRELYRAVTGSPDAYLEYYDGLDYGYDVSGLDDMPRTEAETVLRGICLNMLEGLQEEMLEIVPPLPENAYSVKFVEESLEESLSPAFFMIPPIDDYLDNVIYVNLGSVDISSLYPTLAHEGYPGHLYQMAYFNGTEHHPIRNLITFDGYTEGWATYTENLSYDMFDFGKYDKEFDKLGKLFHLKWLALYSRVDVGVNFEGWGRSEVAQCMEKNYFNGEMADELIKMVVSSPATPLKYFVGYLEITDILEDVKSRLGNKFDLIEFHKQLLDIGPMQFGVIREYMDEYVGQKLGN